MKPLHTAAMLVPVLSVLLSAPFDGIDANALLVGFVSALVVTLGALVAPVSAKAPLSAVDGDAAFRRLKNQQLVAGAVATYAALLLITHQAGLAAMIGILVAVAIGALRVAPRTDT